MKIRKLLSFSTLLHRCIVQQSAELFPRDGINPCRLAVLPLRFAVVGNRIALVVSRWCGPQLPIFSKNPPHGRMIRADTAYLQHIDHIAHVEPVLRKVFGLHNVADDRQHFGFGLAAVVVYDPPQGIGDQQPGRKPHTALFM